MQALYQTAQHIYEKRERSGSVSLTNGYGSPTLLPRFARYNSQDESLCVVEGGFCSLDQANWYDPYDRLHHIYSLPHTFNSSRNPVHYPRTPPPHPPLGGFCPCRQSTKSISGKTHFTLDNRISRTELPELGQHGVVCVTVHTVQQAGV